MKKLRHFVRTEGKRYLDDPNITSIGVGYKVEDGVRTDTVSLQFTVRIKGAQDGAVPEGVETRLIPDTIEVAGTRVPTDVVQRSFEPALRSVSAEEADIRKLRSDPVMPGISVSHVDGSAGTLGAIVYDRGTGDACILSNWHVLQGGSGEIGDTIVQPGPHDDNNTQGNSAGRLLRSHLGDAGDCAIARIEDRGAVADIFELDVRPEHIGEVELGDPVVKSGRTTGVTRGVVRRTDVIVRLYYGPDVGFHDVGGFEIGPEDGAAPGDEITLGGDSGSAWVSVDDQGDPAPVMVGLHFAGEGVSNPDEHALACYAHSVFKKLNIALMPPAPSELQADIGFDATFLAERVDPPQLTQAARDDSVLLDGRALIPYTHFSVNLSASRRLARYVAWNIDGGRIRRLSRSGIRFRLDPRIPAEFQFGNELYVSNPLDRGHVARRADLVWGALPEAERANRDSFFYTNIAPQHEAFNRSSMGGLWGQLENALFEDVEVEDLRVSVLGGPVFRDDDQEYRDAQIPRDYWKLVAYGDRADERFKVRAFLLTQRDLLTGLESLELDPFRLFQVSLDRLQQETSLSFESLRPFDTMGVQPEGVDEPAEARRVRRRSQLFAG